MSQASPLQRAHALAAQASQLLEPDGRGLERAVAAYREAADLFDQSQQGVTDESAKKTLQMLAAQNRKAARDAERRTALSAKPAAHPPSVRRSVTEPAHAAPLTFDSLSRPLPFALRPPAPTISGAALGPAEAGPSAVSRRDGLATSAGGLGPTGAVSPLYSSSSSSEPADESYVIHGAIKDTLDPFSRFWGMLDNMLDDISNPVRFASAPLDVPPAPAPAAAATTSRPRDKDREREQRKTRQRAASPSESFYVVPPHGRVRDEGDEVTEVYAPIGAPPIAKTPEELALENESLRASLDALAKHAQTLEDANRQLNEQRDERDKLVRSVIHGVRREARMAKIGQDVMRSQLLGQSREPFSGPDDEGKLRKRVEELEVEVRHLQGENESQRAQLDKYKERWDKLKAKKEAKHQSDRERPRR